jgi:hypothetical protein
MFWDQGAGVNIDLDRLVAAAADLCRKPLRHAVLDAMPEPPSNDERNRPEADDLGLGRRPTDRHQASAADDQGPSDEIGPGADVARQGLHTPPTDCCLRLVVRSLQGERLPEEDLELEIYRSGDELNLTMAWLAFEERPVLWQGSHPVWMDGTTGQRCERPDGGAQLEALARRLRALLVNA